MTLSGSKFSCSVNQLVRELQMQSKQKVNFSTPHVAHDQSLIFFWTTVVLPDVLNGYACARDGYT